jgi:DNA-binding transcriptional LysR family regulator
VRLTDAGELLATYAQRVFDAEHEAEQALAELRNLERGHLTVGASTTIGVYLLPEICAQFQQQYPRIEMRLIVDNTHAIRQGLLENRFDLALTEGPIEAGELQPDVFLLDEIVAVAAPTHPLIAQSDISIEQLLTAGLILREAGSGTRAVIEAALSERGFTVQPLMSLGNTEAIKLSVATGHGVALLSRLAIQAEVADRRLVVLPIPDLLIQRPFYRLKLRGKYEGRALREFLRILRQSLRNA